jgi:hypothetical protein
LAPILHAGGTYPPRALSAILGGILAFESEWNPALGPPLLAALGSADDDSHLGLGCIAAHGIFAAAMGGGHEVALAGKPATAFLFELIARLQNCATVPID